MAVVQPNAVPVLAPRRKDRPRREADAVLEGAPVQLQAVDGARQLEPHEVPALGLRDALVAAPVLAQRREQRRLLRRQRAPQLREMRVEAAAAQHLGDAVLHGDARRERRHDLAALHVACEAPRRHPTDAIAGRQALRATSRSAGRGPRRSNVLAGCGRLRAEVAARRRRRPRSAARRAARASAANRASSRRASSRRADFGTTS